MNAGLPTELECIAERLNEGAQDAVIDMQSLSHMFEVAKTWEAGRMPPPAIATMQHAARAMQFDIQRLKALLQTQTTTLRRVYSLSLYGVDSLRIAGAVMPGAVPQGMNAAMETLADMQEAIQALFPDDKTLGE